MKKILIVFFCIMLISVNIFAETKDLSNGNGNGGKNKIGAWLGFPFMGLSYSHEFNDLMELDLLAGVTGLPFISRQINLRTGLLFTIWEPVINGQKCPLTIGPAVDINSFMLLLLPASFGVTLLSPIRWEVNFRNAPSFNLFIEVAPAIGFSYEFLKIGNSNSTINIQNVSIKNIQINDKFSMHWIPHIGLGLRYRIPNKK